MTALAAGADFDVEHCADAFAVQHGATAADVTNLWAGELGYFTVAAALPAGPNMPTIRAYQARSRDALPPVVRRRIADRAA